MSKIDDSQEGATNASSERFSRYVAIGDSISIDRYPELDLVARREEPPAGGVGAASLFHRNIDSLWPEFEGHDLVTRYPTIEHVDLCQDGAVTTSVLEFQLTRLPADAGDPTLLTLTVGGNDLLGLIGTGEEHGTAVLNGIIERLREIVDRFMSAYEDSTLIIGTVYDPSDGTARLGDGILRQRELEWLGVYNDAVRRLATETGSLLADIHEHFYGHGLTEPQPARRWYWPESIIEPAARGASEVRRLWLDCLNMAP